MTCVGVVEAVTLPTSPVIGTIIINKQANTGLSTFFLNVAMTIYGSKKYMNENWDCPSIVSIFSLSIIDTFWNQLEVRN
jgi:hypothetical protein